MLLLRALFAAAVANYAACAIIPRSPPTYAPSPTRCHRRSLLAAGTSAAAEQVPLDSRSSAFCSFDGRARQELCPGDSVMIAMSRWPVPMVCNLDASHDWFLSMRDGLSWNVRKKQAGAGQ